MSILPDSRKLIDIVRHSAKQELLTRFQRVTQELKADGSIITEADLAMQKSLSEKLNKHWPDIPFLGEEMSSKDQQSVMDDSSTGFWCLDPLDGTANFVAGMPCFAISLAYLQQGETHLGIIFDPIRRECFTAQSGMGAWLR